MPEKEIVKMSRSWNKTKWVLNDYLYNLHFKFLAENGTTKISLAVFSRLRPRHISLVKFRCRKICLCQRHKNMALKGKVLEDNKVVATENPDILVKHRSNHEILENIASTIADDTVTFPEWRRVTVEKKGRHVNIMQIVQVEESKAKCKQILENDLSECKQHIERVKCQFEQSRKLKELLPIGHAICYMDFAENYVYQFAI